MKLIFLVLLAISLFGCEVISNANQHSFIDVKLIGTWEGEYTEQGGTIKSWTQTRKADGTYLIEFSFTELDGTTKRFTESGRWWVKEDLFHEIASSGMEQPDRYQYHFKRKNCVNFVLVESNGLAENIDSYEFSECLSEDSPLVSAGRLT